MISKKLPQQIYSKLPKVVFKSFTSHKNVIQFYKYLFKDLFHRLLNILSFFTNTLSTQVLLADINMCAVGNRDDCIKGYLLFKFCNCLRKVLYSICVQLLIQNPSFKVVRVLPNITLSFFKSLGPSYFRSEWIL